MTPATPDAREPIGVLVARFETAYPGLYAAPGRWRTHDGVIPWKLFLLLLGGAAHVRAAEQLRLVDAVHLGYARAHNADDFKVRHAYERLRARAFPTVPTAAAPRRAADDSTESP